MKKILLYNPAISSINRGDEIISLSAKKQISNLLEDSYVVEISSHLPVNRVFYHSLLKDANFDHKFVLGSNLLMGNLTGSFRQWDINIINAKDLGPAVLLGCGWWRYDSVPQFVTKKIYQRILSDDHKHSVRDDFTAERLNDCGIKNVIVTGCPTMWDFNESFCNLIPSGKANSVCTTITDYKTDFDKDLKMLQILKRNYEKVYFWIQGLNDLPYFEQLVSKMDNDGSYPIELVLPEVHSFDTLLEKEDIDYVGTRLHAGIRALQHKRRTIIISIDNRAKEMDKSFNLPILKRESINDLEDMIRSDFRTNIHVPEDKITEWKKQFN